MTTSDRPTATSLLIEEQLTGLGDMSSETLRAAPHQGVDAIADYIGDIEQFEVQPAIVRAWELLRSAAKEVEV